MLIFQSFKVVICSFAQLIKKDTKRVTLKISVVIVMGQAVQYSRVGLAKLLFGNISLLIKVHKNSQFKVKIVVFTTVLKFINIELSQIGQLLTISLCLSKSPIYNLNNSRRVLVHILIYRGITVRILGYRGIAIHSLKIGFALAYKINSKST